MKGRMVVLGHLNREEAAALMQDGQLVDLILTPDVLAPGTIVRGVVERLMKGQGAAFLRLPDGQRGYLRERSGLREGRPMLVQVRGVAEDGKAIPLSARLLLRGRHVLVTPDAPGVSISRRIRDLEIRAALEALGRAQLDGRDYGMIMRSVAATAPQDEVADELAALIEVADRLLSEGDGPPEYLLDAPTAWEQAWMEWAEPAPDAIEEGEDSFDRCGVTDALEALLSDLLPLPGGASAAIEPTRALVAIDVNTGNDTSPAAALKANIALARDLPRQLRLRGLGGQVAVDFAPMPKRDRATLDQVLQAAFKGEAAETTLIGWTTMGLYEINRKRDRVPLMRLIGES
ncbi:ribonuclease E/G [Paracoccus sp. (in: a-proteobacteria)]|uniref:ribonuclease E/G n=1 Tax=Paracoccus sp. TaxID=267 RepID=UPI003A879904